VVLVFAPGEMDLLKATEWTVLERLAGGAPLGEILHAIVELVERQAPGMLCSILLYDKETGTLRHGAASNLPGSFVRAIDGNRVGPEEGSCGTAAFTGERVIVDDIATHPAWKDYRALALPLGLRACWSTPIFSSHRELLGTFAMYYRETRGPTQQEMDWVGMATHLAALAIVRDQAEKAVRESEERLRVQSQLAAAMRDVVEPAQVLPVALRILGQHLGVSRCSYAVVQSDEDRCTVPDAYTEGVPHVSRDFRLSDFGPELAAELRRGERPVVARDVAAELPPEASAPFVARDIRAFIICSLVRQGSLRAMMAVHQSEPRNWLPNEIAIVREFVEWCWSTIEQRVAESKLRESEALLRIAGRAARLGGFSITAPGLRIALSDEVCAIHEVPAGTAPTIEQALGFYAPEFRDHVQRSVEACFADGTPFDFEAQLVTAKGRRIWVRVIGLAEHDGASKVTRVHGAFQDVEERRKLEEQLRQAQKMEAVGQLAGGVAHDFNNLLSVILSYATLTAQSLPRDDPRRSDVDEISKAAQRAGELTRQLLAFSRQQVQELRVFDVNAVVEGLRRMLRRAVGDDVQLVISLGASLGNVRADPGQIEQVILNLVVNAGHAMPNGGNLSIETFGADVDASDPASSDGIPPGPYVVLAVTDTGLGMDIATRARIFEPFFTTKAKGKGTGLGLSTVWGIVTQSQGFVRVDSELGRGSRFEVYLPRVEPELDVRVTEVPVTTARRGTETILLVENDEQVRSLVRAVLTRNGYKVLEAANGGEAFLIAEQYEAEVHLLFTDVVMPRMSGYDLWRRIRQMRPATKVLFSSGAAEHAPTDERRAHSGASFLAKPITPDVLLAKVREILDAP
jgi:signal transduction histidine kinase